MTSEVEAVRQAKSLSSEQTFATDIHDTTILLESSSNRWKRLRSGCAPPPAEGPDQVTLKLRYGDFRTVTRSETLGDAHESDAGAVGHCRPCSASGNETRRARSPVGIRRHRPSVAGEEPGHAVADPQAEKFERLDQVVDAICDLRPTRPSRHVTGRATTPNQAKDNLLSRNRANVRRRLLVFLGVRELGTASLGFI